MTYDKTALEHFDSAGSYVTAGMVQMTEIAETADIVQLAGSSTAQAVRKNIDMHWLDTAEKRNSGSAG